MFVTTAFFVYGTPKGVDTYTQDTASSTPDGAQPVAVEPVHVLDIVAYDKKMNELANNPKVATSTATSTKTVTTASSTVKAPVKKLLWPVKAVYPNYGALLPFNRIVAYYGNYYSKQMGVLGEYPEDVMLQKLQGEVKKWELADPSTPVIPAIHYIATTAQRLPGKDNSYMLRMPFSQIDKSLDLAKKANGIVFLDIQTGNSNLVREVGLLQTYLAMPQVHLGIDPEFAMQNSGRPGTIIGTIDAKEINQVAELLAEIVRKNNLPPKILIIHRFTEKMVTHYQDIRPLPEVQIVMDMDGWGDQHLKKQTYRTIITQEPVQFAGFKLFYKNDIRTPGSTMLTPQDILKLQPAPSYIQYQ